MGQGYYNFSIIPIEAGDQAALVAFLETLTDETFLKNPNHAKP